ncbi:MAG TPA: TonB family protein [Burkholderiales bacterium]|nr:TonB family protein [Burkholderiales bacterium]
MAGRRFERLLAAFALAALLAPVAVQAAADGPTPHYYRSTELDVRPGIMVRVEPQYPVEAARRGLSGQVVLDLYLSESGAVERVVAVKGNPPGVFDDAARRAFAAARFTPGMKDGRAVKVLLRLEVSFENGPR